MITRDRIISEMCDILSRVLSSDNDVEAFMSAISSFAQSKDPSEFRFNVSKVMTDDFLDDVNRMIDNRSSHLSDMKSHRAELWRQAVISATNVKHNAPIEYGDKVIERYDDLFELK